MCVGAYYAGVLFEGCLSVHHVIADDDVVTHSKGYDVT